VPKKSPHPIPLSHQDGRRAGVRVKPKSFIFPVLEDFYVRSIYANTSVESFVNRFTPSPSNTLFKGKDSE
jgi:hypothetical protein